MKQFIFYLLLIPRLVFSNYLIGTGIYDITGPAAELGMMGYAKTSQVAEGIHQRLRARAFVIVAPHSSKRIAIVVADLGMLTQSIHQGVLRNLKKIYGNRYTGTNVLLSATHTHSGPGGYAHYALYNITTYGFSQQNYDVIVNGIVEAIKRADNNLEQGKILYAQDDLVTVSKNRSLLAYENNPLEEQRRYRYPFDTKMTLLKFTADNEHELGALNWFPLHGVSMSNRNRLISGDNKGYASYLFEQKKGTDYHFKKTFVAAFAQENEGDVSPNIHQLDDDNSIPDNTRTKEAGEGQFQTALNLYENATNVLEGDIDSRMIYVKLTDVVINNNQHPCPAALGYSFAAGTVDGKGVDFFKEGELESNIFIDAVTGMIKAPSQELIDCQSPKPILLPVGQVRPTSWVPDILPVQLIKLGNIIIAALPVEITTMSGRRIRDYLNNYFPHHIIITAGLSNGYTGYLTTPEEYEIQNYEGGHNVFGANSLLAYETILGQLATAIKNHTTVVSHVSPPDLSESQLSFQTPVLFDDVPLFHHFGDIKEQKQFIYQPGDVVSVDFWSGHPKNNLMTQESYFVIQNKKNGKWIDILYDWDWDTDFSWHRSGVAFSYITVRWRTHKNINAGDYRIIVQGAYKDALTRDRVSYKGISDVFTFLKKENKDVANKDI